MSELPTIEQCHAFMDAINVGREALGLERIDTLEYDECEPGSAKNCLSARHLFNVDGDGSVQASTVSLSNVDNVKVLAEALMTDLFTDYCFVIPMEIRRVTDLFDRGAPVDEWATEREHEIWQTLRDRLKEAGLVE